jgi:hypothetical protein
MKNNIFTVYHVSIFSGIKDQQFLYTEVLRCGQMKTINFIGIYTGIFFRDVILRNDYKL